MKAKNSCYFKPGDLIQDVKFANARRRVLFAFNGRYYFCWGSLSKFWVEMFYERVRTK